MSVAMTDGDVE